MVNTQDLGIVERVQLGLSNTAFTGGRMCPKFEEPLHRYQNWVADRMCDIHRVPPGDDALEKITVVSTESSFRSYYSLDLILM